MSEPAVPPVLDELVAELKRLRELGVTALRRTPFATLEQAARLASPARTRNGDEAEDDLTVEALLRLAVERLKPGRLGDAAAYSFGLVPGTRDWAAYDRRRRGADLYGVGVDRFRKRYEPMVVDEVAAAILALCRGAEPRPDPPATAGLATATSVEMIFDGRPVPLTVHCRSMEFMTDVDILVSPENTYFEVATMFKASVSASLRRRAAVRGAAGEVIDDVVRRELDAWMLAHATPGLSVTPGTVVPSSGGELARQGIRRIYHAAVASPRAGTNGYDVDPAAVSLAVKNVFQLARAEGSGSPAPLTSIAFPLLGAGRGGLDPMTSLGAIWSSLEDELRSNARWSLHFVARDPRLSEQIRARIIAGAAS